MPYIKLDQRKKIDNEIDALLSAIKETSKNDEEFRKGERKGILNYVVTRIVWGLIKDEVKYDKINDIVGSLECCKLEFSRRVAAE